MTNINLGSTMDLLLSKGYIMASNYSLLTIKQMQEEMKRACTEFGIKPILKK